MGINDREISDLCYHAREQGMDKDLVEYYVVFRNHYNEYKKPNIPLSRGTKEKYNDARHNYALSQCWAMLEAYTNRGVENGDR